MEQLKNTVAKLNRENKNLNKEMKKLQKEMNKRDNKVNKRMDKVLKVMERMDKRNNMRGGAETEGATFMASEFYQKTDPSTNAQTVTSGSGAYPPPINNNDKVVNMFMSEPASVMPSKSGSYPEMRMAPGQSAFTMSGGAKKKRNNKR